MKARPLRPTSEPIPLIVLLPREDHRIYAAALRVLRRLMGNRTPSLETLLLQDLHGRDATGIADNYLDAIAWPLERGRAITVRIQDRTRRQERMISRSRRAVRRIARPLADPTKN
ncbi:hypothetical protein [Oleiharenicola lentus]|uniref:hypothetical protein n=1 Tax=Oleiharenicola lentus TaxID=2508720 RepID=UPI003F6678E8